MSLAHHSKTALTMYYEHEQLFAQKHRKGRIQSHHKKNIWTKVIHSIYIEGGEITRQTLVLQPGAEKITRVVNNWS